MDGKAGDFWPNGASRRRSRRREWKPMVRGEEGPPSEEIKRVVWLGRATSWAGWRGGRRFRVDDELRAVKALANRRGELEGGGGPAGGGGVGEVGDIGGVYSFARREGLAVEAEVGDAADGEGGGYRARRSRRAKLGLRCGGDARRVLEGGEVFVDDGPGNGWGVEVDGCRVAGSRGVEKFVSACGCEGSALRGECVEGGMFSSVPFWCRRAVFSYG